MIYCILIQKWICSNSTETEQKMTSKILVKKHDSLKIYEADYFGVDIAKMNGAEPLPYKTKPCFFLERELGRTARDLYATNQYRHCKIYCGRFLDYITKQEFRTLEEWVASCGSTMDQVLFGYNKFDQRASYIRLSQLMNEISPPQQDVDIITSFMNKLAVDELSLQDVHVNAHGMMKNFNDYMNDE